MNWLSSELNLVIEQLDNSKGILKARHEGYFSALNKARTLIMLDLKEAIKEEIALNNCKEIDVERLFDIVYSVFEWHVPERNAIAKANTEGDKR